MTTTLFNIIQSELIKRGFNEYVNANGDLVFFENENQFMTKIISYDDDVSSIVDEFFSGRKLDDNVHDLHFKKAFLYRFINRRINRQTIEAFRMEMLTTLLMNEGYINRVYADMEKYITQTAVNDQRNKQTNNQSSNGSSTTDNRSAYADLPQNNVQLDVNSTVMDSASNNNISRNKQTNADESSGESSGESSSENKVYRLDELFRSNGILENILNNFDRKCFLQVW